MWRVSGCKSVGDEAPIATFCHFRSCHRPLMRRKSRPNCAIDGGIRSENASRLCPMVVRISSPVWWAAAGGECRECSLFSQVLSFAFVMMSL